MTLFKQIRYGTPFFPMTVTRILPSFPPNSFFSITDPESSKVKEMDIMGPRSSESILKTVGVPSVSVIVGCTESMQNLYRWQQQLIYKMGRAGFSQYMTRRMRIGTRFHSVVEALLKELKVHGEIRSTPEEILASKPNWSELSGELTPYFTGLLPFLKSLNPNPNIILEGKVDNPFLCFKGRFDAIVEIDGELTLVDWKTINKESVKSNNLTAQTPEDLYTNPLQLAAYVSAVNACSLYSDLPRIQKAAIVLAYENRDTVEVVKMDLESIQGHFKEFLSRVNRFWWDVEHKPEKGGLLNFVHNPKVEQAT
ncbi:unnamed protein product [Bursaphelenchus xylophilus]|uniref:(pine wood nematode) hypothetical protein n=1 Tax=Bursaphelenchus xylophilus TaxID=6326 RepID=A0A1I7RRQ8_BURXY|nr:unnamed protein product [Bursaphelenchus xylophilus]CAG9123540.1 unnamed protein product [Bursaphelenchus xylophilus]